MIRLVGFGYLLIVNCLLVTAQVPAASQWCDGLSAICFWRHRDPDLDISWGYLFPPAGRDEFIGFFTGPASTGWIGNSLGGGMRLNPLVLGWVNENKAIVTIRRATGYSPPQPLTTGPKVILLGTSGSNSTHLRIFYRCQNCTTWTGGTGGINLDGSHTFGFATHAAIRPISPADPNSSLYQHTEAYQHTLNAVNARSASYDIQLAELSNAPPLEPGSPPTTTEPVPTPTNGISCPNAPAPTYAINAAPGWRVTTVLGRLSSPRAITVDSKGNVLILQRDIGVTGHQVDDVGCIISSKMIIADLSFNHGLDVVGNKLYASSSDIAWVWDYDPTTLSVSNKRALVTTMHNPFHLTRSIHVSRKYPDYISLSVGSDGNLDIPSFDPALGRSQIRVFDMRGLPTGGASYNSSYGKVFGYGLRNNVGIAEDRNGNVYSIENSLDDAHRVIDGVQRDIHDDNPAEKVYLLGKPPTPDVNLFGGYPYCYTVWELRDIADVNLTIGGWFVQNPAGQYTDAWCEANAVKPLVILPPHTAPLDIKFGVREDDNNLYVGLHGSSARTQTLGYKVLIVPGRYSATGEWMPTVDLAGTKTSTVDLFFNRNETQCRGGCFRPVGLAFSPDGNSLYITSDTSGEVFLLKAPGTAEPPTTTTTPAPAPPTTTSSGPRPTQSMYGQCGGSGFTGPSVCTSGSTCKVINPFFSQCLP